MFVDIKDTTRVKLCLRNYGGGGFLPNARKYICSGYDCVCLCNRGIYIPEAEGLMPSYECKIGNGMSTDGEYTILGIGVTSDPEIPEDWENMIKTSSAKAVEAIRRIHIRNGYAVLRNAKANTADEIARLEGLDAVEICGEDGHVSDLLNELSSRGINLGVVCSGNDLLGSICVEAKSEDCAGIVRALKAGRFFSSEGDGEIHISATPSGRVRVDCSPASEIRFFTNEAHTPDKIYTGENLICAEYIPRDGEKFIRAQMTDMQGQSAWTNYIEV